MKAHPGLWPALLECCTVEPSSQKQGLIFSGLLVPDGLDPRFSTLRVHARASEHLRSSDPLNFKLEVARELVSSRIKKPFG